MEIFSSISSVYLSLPKTFLKIQFYNYQWPFYFTDKVYAWGDNEFGQLGFGKNTTINKTHKPRLIEDLKDITICQISCGSGHTLVLNTDGVVYGWGDNSDGQIGCNRLEDYISGVFQLKELPKVKSIYCSNRQSFAITTKGFVYSWGDSENQRLGHDLESNDNIYIPKQIINLSQVKSICFSSFNTYFLKKKDIYFCGKYEKKNHEYFQSQPKLMKKYHLFAPKFKTLVSKIYYTKNIGNSRWQWPTIGTALTNNKHVYSFENTKLRKTMYTTLEEFYAKEHQICVQTIYIDHDKVDNIAAEYINSITEKYLDEKTISINLLTKYSICANSNLDNFSIKLFHIFDDPYGYNMLFVTNEDNVYGFGSNYFGVCGFGHNKNVKDPKIIPELRDKNIQQFFIGIYFVLAMTSENEFYGWGDNNGGQLGLGYATKDKLQHNDRQLMKPILIEALNNFEISQICCGFEFVLILTTDGLVYGWGDVRCAHTELEKDELILEITKIELPKIKYIGLAGALSYAVSENGEVYFWRVEPVDPRYEHDEIHVIFPAKKLNNLSNIASVCFSFQCKYYLSKQGEIYFDGIYYDEKLEECYQSTYSPDLLKCDSKFHSLYSIEYQQKGFSIGCAVSDDGIFSLQSNKITKTIYETIEDFFSNECQMTYKTNNLEYQTSINEKKLKLQGLKSLLLIELIIIFYYSFRKYI